MGIVDSKDDKNMFLKTFRNNFTYLKEISDPTYGDICILIFYQQSLFQELYQENDGQRKIFVKEIFTGTDDEYSIFLKSCQQRNQLDHPNISKLIQYEVQKLNQTFSESAKFTCYCDYYDHNLQNEIGIRNQKQHMFQETEIWYLLYTVSSACSYLERKNIYQGDIRSKNILLNSLGQIKLLDQGLMANSSSNYQKTLQRGEQTYLSQQQMSSLAKQRRIPNHNPFKSDVFSLGMTVLEACILRRIQECYNFRDYTINFQNLQNLLYQAQSRYSPLLINILQMMLNPEEEKRPYFSDIIKFLSQYEQLILNLQPFLQYTQVMQNGRLFLANGIMVSQTRPTDVTQGQRLSSPQRNINLPNQENQRRVISPQPYRAQSPQGQIIQRQLRTQQSPPRVAMQNFPQTLPSMMRSRSPSQIIQSQIMVNRPLSPRQFSPRNSFTIQNPPKYSQNQPKRSIDERVREALQQSEQTMKKHMELQERFLNQTQK